MFAVFFSVLDHSAFPFFLPLHCGANQVVLGHLIIHFPTSSVVSEQASEWASAAVHASKASSVEQVNEWAVWANKRTDEWVTQFCRLDSWLFCPSVPCLTRACFTGNHCLTTHYHCLNLQHVLYSLFTVWILGAGTSILLLKLKDL